MARWAVFGALAVGAVLASHAQTPGPRPAFEVASIKLNTTCYNGDGRRAGSSPGRLDLPCLTVRGLIRMAYGAFAGETLNTRRIEVTGGPHWIDTDHYDISAKAAGGAAGPQMMGPMLQALLEDRFQVKVHMGSQDGPAYALTVLKDNPKLQRTKEGSCVPIDLTNMLTAPAVKPGDPRPTCGVGRPRNSNGVTSVSDWYGMTMAEFAGRMLSGVVDRPVIDKTALTGQFDIHIEFVRDHTTGGAMLNGQPIPDVAAPPDDSAGPSIFTALETQLGLKLSPTRAPVDVIVVDHAEKPSAN